METSRALRILVATAVVSALAILLTSPAQARWVNEGGAVTVSAPTVGNPGDGAQAAAPQVEQAVVTSSGSDGLGTVTFVAIAGGAALALVLGAGALLFTARQRRVALP